MSGAAAHEVIIQVGDVAEAVRFYTAVCGMAHVRAIDSGDGTMALLDADGLRIMLVESTDCGMQLSVPTSDAEADERRLRAAGAQIHEPSTQVNGGIWLSFEDPWGNRLGFWQETRDAE